MGQTGTSANAFAAVAVVSLFCSSFGSRFCVSSIGVIGESGGCETTSGWASSGFSSMYMLPRSVSGSGTAARSTVAAGAVAAAAA